MAKISIYENGFSLSPEIVRVKHGGGGKRGKLEGKTSSACFRRLREWCITHDCSGDCWGVTLTVPGLDLLSVTEFKKVHHLLCVWCNDNKVPVIWRVELQVRKMPHLHLVCYGSVDLPLRLMSHWFKLLSGFKVWNDEIIGKEKDIVLVSRAFCKGSVHAVQLEKLSGDFRSYRYLVSHMSKQKQAQLGWPGRSWGVCCRRLFSVVEPKVKHLELYQYYIVCRWLRRLTRFHGVVTVKRRRFGKVVTRQYSRRIERKVKTCAFWLTNPETLRKMIDYIISNSVPVPF